MTGIIWLCIAVVIVLAILFFVTSARKIKLSSKVLATSELCKKIAELNKQTKFNDFKTSYEVKEEMFTQREYIRTNTHDVFYGWVNDNLEGATDLVGVVEENIAHYRDYIDRYNALWQFADADKTINKMERKLFDRSKLTAKTDVTFTVTCFYQDDERGQTYQHSTTFHFDAFRTFFIQAGGVPPEPEYNEQPQPEQQYEQPHEQTQPGGQQKSSEGYKSQTYSEQKRSWGVPPRTPPPPHYSAPPPPKPKTVYLELYKCLELSNTATAEEIKTTYKKLVKKYHPDLNGGDPFFVEKLKALNHAYDILGTPDSRMRYDLDGTE